MVARICLPDWFAKFLWPLFSHIFPAFFPADKRSTTEDPQSSHRILNLENTFYNRGYYGRIPIGGKD